MENPRINPIEYLSYGFDVAIDFQPTNMGDFLKGKMLWKKLINRFTGRPYNMIFKYSDYINFRCNQTLPSYKEFPCVSPGWDNSPRREGKPFMAFIKSSPNLFAKWLDYIMTIFKPYSIEEDFIFINAWNEWAEGNHLEPDQKWGNAYLEEIKNIVNKKNE